MKKKIILILSIIIFTFLNLHNINAIDVREINSIETSCPEADVNEIIYIPINSNSINKFPYDSAMGLYDRYISNESKVWIYDPSDILSCWPWWRYSNILPANQWVLALWANCTFKKPLNSNNRIVQIVYNIEYWEFIRWGDISYNFTYHKNFDDLLNSRSNTKTITEISRIWNYNIHGNECITYEIRYCWEWIVSHGEACDDWNNVNGDGCSSTCQIEIPPSGLFCEATTTWAQTSEVTSATVGLCKKSWETVVNFNTTISWNRSNYTWSCKDTNNIFHTGWNCNASYTIWGWWGWWGWWTSVRCLDIIDNWWDNFTCIWSSRTRTLWIDCDSDWLYEQVKFSNNRSAFTQANWTNSFTFTCNTVDADWNSTVNNPRCGVSRNNINVNQSSGWNTSLACKMQAPYCGNGRIETNEECEKTDTNSDWSINHLDYFPPFCSSSCQFDWNWGTIPVSDWNLTTIPMQGEIGFVGMYDMIIGHNQNLWRLNNRIYIWNNSPYTFGNWVFDWVCITEANVIASNWSYVHKNTWDSISDLWNRYCTDITTRFYPGQKIYLEKDLSSIIANKNKVDWPNYEDNKLVVTIRTRENTDPYSRMLNWSDHLTGKFKVRVARPALQTTAWTSFNKFWANTQKIAESWGININDWRAWINNNDVWVWTKSSSAQVTTNEKVVWETVKYSEGSTIISGSTNTSFEKYNGLSNVFIKKGNTNMSSINYSTITQPTTFIIDNGNLIIDTNVIPSHNYNLAFVLKNWNIIINSNIIEIKWTYIVLNWKIKSDGTATNNVLIIRGSIYWDTRHLINDRINVEESDWKLSFGTIVSFGSSIFQKPAPMVTSFINTYLKSNKIAK